VRFSIGILNVNVLVTGPEEEEVVEATKDLVTYIEQLEGVCPYDVALQMLMMSVGADECPPLKGTVY
jgi:hypothetical protein